MHNLLRITRFNIVMQLKPCASIHCLAAFGLVEVQET